MTDNVSITGPGADRLTVRRGAGAAGNFRIFNVTTTGIVTFSGLTISNGLVVNGFGGGIQNVNAGTVNVANSTVSVNFAAYTGGNAVSGGGGISNNSTGTVNVTNSTISGNSADFVGGGGIYNNSTGTVNVTNSTISGNSTRTVNGNVNGNGGGILNSFGGTLNIANSTLSGNSATNYGGGIVNEGSTNAQGTVSVTNSTISGNTSHNGGGIQNDGTLTVIGSTISGNSSTMLNGTSSSGDGGGISAGGTVNISNSTISSNTSQNRGGGIVAGGTVVNIANSTINGNSAVLSGGIVNYGFLQIINSTISGNSASAPDVNGFGNAGGIMNNSGGFVSLTNSTISGNTSPVSGGIFNSPINNSFVQVKSTIVALNTGSSSSPDVLGSFQSSGFNLIGKKDESVGFTMPTDQTGTIASPLDPKLDPSGLKDNGGPTQTVALLFGSPAIDKGTSNGLTGHLTTDQRGTGFPRTFDDPAIPNATGGDGTDIGAFEVQTAAPTPTPTPTPTPGASPTPTVTPTTLANISTRLRVETGDNALIGGFIVTGTQPKRVIVRAIGPSLTGAGVPGALADPILELHDSSSLIGSNDNWRSTQEAEIIATGIPPSNDLESALVMTLPANNSAYTAIVRGVNGGTGVGLVEVYDLDRTVDSKLANISTRGLVQTGDNVMIGGFIVVGQASQRVIVRAIGPSLPVPGKLADPTLELRDGNGALIASNDNWRSDQEAEIIATTIPPTNDLESAIVRTLSPAAYTAIVRGVNNTTGIALVEVYALN